MKLRIPKCHAITHPNLYNTYSDLCLIMLLILVTPGTGRKFRRLNLSAANDKLGADVCHALPGMHAFTGCDTTSSFAFHGKKSAFKLLCDDSPLGSTIRQACRLVFLVRTLHAGNLVAKLSVLLLLISFIFPFLTRPDCWEAETHWSAERQGLVTTLISNIIHC